MISPKEIADIFSELELLLIKSLVRNLSAHKEWEKSNGFDWSAWQAEKLKGINLFRKKNKTIAKHFFSSINKETKDMLTQQWNENTQAQGFFGVNTNRLNSLISEMQTIENNVQKAVLRNIDDVYRQAVYKTSLGLNSSSMTLNQAIDVATKDLLDKGIKSIEYSNGRKITTRAYIEMALRTNYTRAAFYAQGSVMDKMGIDTVLCSQYGACSNTCLPWQGKVYIDDVFHNFKGKKGVSYGIANDGNSYLLLSYAMEKGLFHPNCRHHISIFDPSVNTIPKPLDEKEVKRVYSLEQEQRRLEREVRKYKRYVVGSLEDKTKEEYKDKLKVSQKNLREFISENNDVLKRNYFREKVDGYSIEDTRRNHIINILPKASEAIIPKEKFTLYALNPLKDINKATAFKEALGYSIENVDKLIENIYNNINKFNAIEKPDNGYGVRYEIIMTLQGENGKKANVKTAWILDNATKEMRLTSAYVTQKKYKE